MVVKSKMRRGRKVACRLSFTYHWFQIQSAHWGTEWDAGDWTDQQGEWGLFVCFLCCLTLGWNRVPIFFRMDSCFILAFASEYESRIRNAHAHAPGRPGILAHLFQISKKWRLLQFTSWMLLIDWYCWRVRAINFTEWWIRHALECCLTKEIWTLLIEAACLVSLKLYKYKEYFKILWFFIIYLEQGQNHIGLFRTWVFVSL